MNPLRLAETVQIDGKDIFGCKAWIKFSPTNTPGWFWRPHSQELPIPITADLVSHKSRRLVLRDKAFFFHIYEHVGCLRWTGLDGVILESTPYPPFHGCAADIWEGLEPHCKQDTSREIAWFTVTHPIKSNHISDVDRYVIFHPHDAQQKPSLRITINVNYPGIGRKKYDYKLKTRSLATVLASTTLGWPPWLYYLSRIGSSLRVWHHHNRINWPQEHSPEEILERVVLHRMGDLLGALSLVNNEGLLAGHILSNCAGHEADAGLVHAINAHKDSLLSMVSSL